MGNMSETNELQDVDLSPLRALRREAPATRMAQVRKAWPDIRFALEAGHSLKVVHQRLKQGGLSIPYRTLVGYVSRIRFEQSKNSSPRATEGKRPSSPSVPGPRSLTLTGPDPLAQAMEACAKPRYDITAAHCDGDPTKKKLI